MEHSHKKIIEWVWQIPAKRPALESSNLMDIIIFIQCGKSALNECDHIHSVWTFQCMPFDGGFSATFNDFCESVHY